MLPKAYKVLPGCIPFEIPGFETYNRLIFKTLTPSPRNVSTWYETFIKTILEARSTRYLPICRMSDGEMRFVCTHVKADVRWSFKQHLRVKLSEWKRLVVNKGRFSARTVGHYHSGLYSQKERKDAQHHYGQCMQEIAQKGILAIHFEHHDDRPFHENYFPAFYAWLNQYDITLGDNYFPFYFVYALCVDPRAKGLYENQRILVINGERGEKKQKIINGLKIRGAKEVLWQSISQKRSLHDSIDITPLIGKADIALIGAGIGKPNILCQLEKLQIPCIDIGYMFEVIAGTAQAPLRSFSSFK